MTPPPMTAAFFTFPVSGENYRYAKDSSGYSSIAKTIVFGQTEDIINKNKWQETDVDYGRMEKIMRNITEAHDRAGTPFNELQPLAHGKKGVVFQTSPTHVVRLQLGETPRRPSEDYILQPLQYAYDPETNITIEVMEKVDTSDISQDDINAVRTRAAQDNIHVWDLAKGNFGRTRDNEIKIVDPDSFSFKPKL